MYKRKEHKNGDDVMDIYIYNISMLYIYIVVCDFLVCVFLYGRINEERLQYN